MTQKSRRILIFTTAYRPMIGGSEIALEEIIRRLPDIFFDIITPRYSQEYKTLEMGSNFCIHRVGPGFEIAKVALPVFGFFKATDLMRNHTYKAAHAYQASYGGGAAWLVKIFNPKLPFILTMQEGKQLNEQPAMINFARNLIIKKADVVTVISNYLKNYVLKISQTKKVISIPNGVDLKKFQVPEHKLQAEFNFLGNKGNTAITVSRLVPKNGLRHLIEAFKLLMEKYEITDAKLIIIGDGPQRGKLYKLANELGLSDKIEFSGSVPNSKLSEYLSSASVFIRPSLSEGLGTAFLEAMAAGVPIIGTPIGGIPDFLKDGVTGVFCKPGDPADIAEKLAGLFKDANLREKISKNARKLIEEKYDWNIIAGKFKELYSLISYNE